MIVGGLVIVAVCVWLCVMFGRELMLGNRARAANDVTEQAILRERLDSQRIQRDLRVMSTPAGIQRAARKFGWTLPNEQRLRVSDN
jgi:hypothetical protein